MSALNLDISPDRGCMNIGRAILLIALVFPGLMVVGTSIYAYNAEYAAMERTERYIERLARERRGDSRQLDLAYHRSTVHRINAFTNSTWGFIGGIIAAIGIHGLAVTRDDYTQDQRKS
ncbi:hypothetical protein PCC6912_26150 [Chlorogloeopsis fritschii PCC 6912]|uniref:Uncharacterized protein n=2 Tax=Chlorogloeopsis fritschii TaxID=1124 RepID=A0A3S0YCP4_CHLFR|nr:hypothetical protein PCC6912_26150 [Chlorogloeopsis fritschii PCC 6912]